MADGQRAGLGPRAVRAAARLGRRVGPHLPVDRMRPVLAAVAHGWVARNPPPVRTWRRNVTLATGREPDAHLVRAGVASWLRNTLEQLALPAWDETELRRRVHMHPEQEEFLRACLAGNGVVLALPHMGNWDLAGAWACSTGMPVATVAEQLAGPEFAAFLAFREGLGMRVYSHRDRGALPALVEDARAHRLVCLVSDRDLDGTGAPVTWPTPAGSRAVTLPVGPALVARRSGATLMGLASTFTEHGTHLELSDPIEHRPGRDGLTEMMADVAAFFASQVQAAPADWHVYQPFFATDAVREGRA